MTSPEALVIAGQSLRSRLLMGTGKFGSGALMRASLEASGAELVTVAMKRVRRNERDEDVLSHIDPLRQRLLPNTSGARSANEAVFAAELAREAMETHWVKLEIHPDPRHLMPDAVQTLRATEELARRGFVVLPYVHADPVLCKQLEEAGAAAVMPLAAPIGSNRGLETRVFLELIIEQSCVPVIVDAGLGAPSHAAAALEMGADAVLVNTAIAAARDPVAMAAAFRDAVLAGRMARLAGLARPEAPLHASASSPLTAFLCEDLT